MEKNQVSENAEKKRYRIKPKPTFARYGSFLECCSSEEALANFTAQLRSDASSFFDVEEWVPKEEDPWRIIKAAFGEDGYDSYELGELNFGADSVVVTDPCYNKDVWCRMNAVPILPGSYNCVVYFSDEGDWGIRVSKLGIYRSNKVREEMDYEYKAVSIGNIGVDAGLAGIFEKKLDFADKQWGKFCEDIRNGNAWLVDGPEMRGVFSSSGYGDGSYEVMAHVCPGYDSVYDGLEIIFIDNGEEDE